MRWRIAIIRWIGLGFALGVVLLFLPKPHDNLFWGVVYNTGHAPRFGAGSIVLLQLSKLLLEERVHHYRHHYYLAFIGCGAAGFGSELLQFFDPGRDADLWDIAHDLLGAAVFLSIAATFDSRARAEFRWVAARPNLIRAIATAALLANFVPIALVEVAYRRRDREFPRIGSFETYWDTWFYTARRGASSARVSAPAGWADHDGSKVLEVSFGKGHYPRLELNEPVPDWTAYSELVIDIYSAHDLPVELFVRIGDRPLLDDPEDRYERRFAITPGPNRLSIDLGEIRAGPVGRELDMSAVRTITFLMEAPQHPIRLYFDNILLQ